MVKSECIFSPQNFVDKLTGNCYIFCSDTISGLLEEIECRLQENGYNDLWDYPLSEINHIVENELDVVLVELTGEDMDGEWKTIYRWFEVPESFREQEED